VPPTLREFDLSGTKPILPDEEERPGLFSKLCSTSPGVASWAQRHLRINSTPSVVRRRTTGRRARILRIRVSRGHLTPVPLPSSLGALEQCRSCPINDSLAFRTYCAENRLTSGTVNPMVKIRRLVWHGWPKSAKPLCYRVGGFAGRRNSVSRMVELSPASFSCPGVGHPTQNPTARVGVSSVACRRC
jgi:hypothetical protein